MANERLEDRIRQLLAERLGLKPSVAESIGDDTDLCREVGLDSPMVMEMVIGIEEILGVEFGDTEFSLAKFSTVAKIAAAVRAKKPDA